MRRSLSVACWLLLALPTLAQAHPAPPGEAVVEFAPEGAYRLVVHGDVAAMVMQALPGHLTRDQVESLQTLPEEELQGWIDDARAAFAEELVIQFDGQPQAPAQIAFPLPATLRDAGEHGAPTRRDEIVISGQAPEGAKTFACTFPESIGRVNFSVSGRAATTLQAIPRATMSAPVDLPENAVAKNPKEVALGPQLLAAASLLAFFLLLLMFGVVVLLLRRHRLRQSLVVALMLCGMPAAARAESLAGHEQAQLLQYLDHLSRGGAANPQRVDQLAEVGFPGFSAAVNSYLQLTPPIAPATHRAYQALLERLGRTALDPWPMTTLYSPEFAAYLTTPIEKSDVSQRLIARLMDSGGGRLACDLAVRLAPEASLRYLNAEEAPQRLAMFDAWNRRLTRGKELRPIVRADQLVGQVAQQLSLKSDPELLKRSLRFVSAWPNEQDRYREVLHECLTSDDSEIVLAGLHAQRIAPALLELNPPLVTKFADQAEVVEQVLENFAFDATHDHSATLRDLWPRIGKDQDKTRYSCLLAMGVHPQGNAPLALEAIKQSPYGFIDVAAPILAAGDKSSARETVAHIFSKSERGHEEALRLALATGLTDFYAEAQEIAVNPQLDQVLRQTALRYLQTAPGEERRAMLPLLDEPNDDVRLTVVQCLGEPRGLMPEYRNEIGPALMRVALEDVSMGHRQEAIYALGRWNEPQAKEFFAQVLADNPPVTVVAGHYNDGLYWRYRLRLVALLGLARLGDEAARKELSELHRQGGEIERMDALLVYLDLKEVAPGAGDDLDSPEPKLVATAAQLIAVAGSEAQRKSLKEKFAGDPLWREFLNSDLDDCNILRIVGLRPGKAPARAAQP